jgi:hypothetical protein
VTASSASGRLSPLQCDFLRVFAGRPSGFFLSGGAVLVGWVLAHRYTDDLDLFVRDGIPMDPVEEIVANKICAARCTTKSALVQEILEAHCLHQPRRSAYDVVRHVVGRLSGPRDLSSGGRHPETFGAGAAALPRTHSARGARGRRHG